MRPKVIICGRPNVGKSTLFNRLTDKARSLVHNQPGVTRDWVAGTMGDLDIDLIDTAGMEEDDNEGLAAQAWQHSLAQINTGNVALLVVDGRAGLTPLDQAIANKLRRQVTQTNVVVVVNKVESLPIVATAAEFHTLGFKDLFTVSAAHGTGLAELREHVNQLVHYQTTTEPVEDKEAAALRVAIIGRPNVGKSTLANKIVGQERMIVANIPGTTIDSVPIEFGHNGRKLTLIDTAGIRRQAKVEGRVEVDGGRSARLAAERADIILFLIDISEGVVHQDQLLANLISNYGKATVLILNKADLLDPITRRKARTRARKELPFMDHVEMVLTSMMDTDFRPDGIVDLALHSLDLANQRVTPNKISKILRNAIVANNPPRSHGKRPSLRYAHQAGTNPPLIVIHGRHVDLIKTPYLRYLASQFSTHLGFAGAPIHIRLKESSGKQAH